MRAQLQAQLSPQSFVASEQFLDNGKTFPRRCLCCRPTGAGLEKTEQDSSGVVSVGGVLGQCEFDQYMCSPKKVLAPDRDFFQCPYYVLTTRYPTV